MNHLLGEDWHHYEFTDRPVIILTLLGLVFLGTLAQLTKQSET